MYFIIFPYLFIFVFKTNFENYINNIIFLSWAIYGFLRCMYYFVKTYNKVIKNKLGENLLEKIITFFVTVFFLIAEVVFISIFCFFALLFWAIYIKDGSIIDRCILTLSIWLFVLIFSLLLTQLYAIIDILVLIIKQIMSKTYNLKNKNI